MKLLINYTPVLRQNTGIGVYANSILPSLLHLPNTFIPGGHAGNSVDRIRRLAWTQCCLPAVADQNNATLIFTPAPEGYLGNQVIPQVVMVHDLRAKVHPELTLQSAYFSRVVPSIIKSCKHVFTNSCKTANDIQDCTSLPDSKITVTPLGYDSSVFFPAVTTYRPLPYPYLLHIGQAYPHKNLARLLKAFAQIEARYPDLRLVLAGKPHHRHTKYLKQLAHSLKIFEKMVLLDYVPYKDLPDLYRSASAFVYPSLWEGFGIPVLEAWACGTPVITSKGTPMEEIVGTAGIIVDPMSIMEIAEAIQFVMEKPRKDAISNQLYDQRLASYSWDLCAAKTVHELQRLM